MLWHHRRLQQAGSNCGECYECRRKMNTYHLGTRRDCFLAIPIPPASPGTSRRVAGASGFEQCGLAVNGTRHKFGSRVSWQSARDLNLRSRQRGAECRPRNRRFVMRIDVSANPSGRASAFAQRDWQNRSATTVARDCWPAATRVPRPERLDKLLVRKNKSPRPCDRPEGNGEPYRELRMRLFSAFPSRYGDVRARSRAERCVRVKSSTTPSSKPAFDPSDRLSVSRKHRGSPLHQQGSPALPI